MIGFLFLAGCALALVFAVRLLLTLVLLPFYIVGALLKVLLGLVLFPIVAIVGLAVGLLGVTIAFAVLLPIAILAAPVILLVKLVF